MPFIRPRWRNVQAVRRNLDGKEELDFASLFVCPAWRVVPATASVKGERSTPFERLYWSVQAAKDANWNLERARQKRRLFIPRRGFLPRFYDHLELPPGSSELKSRLIAAVDALNDVLDELPAQVRASMEDGMPAPVLSVPIVDTPGSRVLFRALNGLRWSEAKSEIEHNRALVNARSFSGATPAIRAAAYGNDEFIRFLATKGADFNLADREGFTALHEAARQGNAACVRLLLSKGARFDARTNLHWTPLLIAMDEHMAIAGPADYLQVIRALMAAEALESPTALHARKAKTALKKPEGARKGSASRSRRAPEAKAPERTYDLFDDQ
ncbi:hypothetical protein OKW49_002834 [Paraburkholderia youngii]|uniref:ankyrin repeat domain-containing protein n=1 Tax=Paraburkholderia youngii TaxID=2782701 RepID=UPI003D1BDBB4